MEDAHACVLHSGWGLCGVFDGHAGTTCSAHIARAFADAAKSLPGPLDADGLKQLCLRLDREFMAATTHRDGAIMDHSGATGTIAQVEPAGGGTWRVLCANVGDSRVIASRSGEAEELTVDHKPGQEQERARIRAAGGWVAGGRVDGLLAVSRAFGDAFFKQSEGGELAHKVIALADITAPAPLSDGDFLLLCCDGVFERGMSADAAVDIASAPRLDPSTPQEEANRNGACCVVDTALAQRTQDNVTCMMVALGRAPDAIPSGGGSPVVVVGAPRDIMDDSDQAVPCDEEDDCGEEEEAVSPPDEGRIGGRSGSFHTGQAGKFERSEFLKYAAQRGTAAQTSPAGQLSEGPGGRSHAEAIVDALSPFSAPLGPSGCPVSEQEMSQRRDQLAESAEAPSAAAATASGGTDSAPPPDAPATPPPAAAAVSAAAAADAGRDYHIVTVFCCPEDLEAAAAAAAAAADGDSPRPPLCGQRWSTREGGCPTGIVLSGQGAEWNSVQHVARGSPGWRAGVRAAMSVVALDGRTVTSLDWYERELRRLVSGPQFELTVQSDSALWAQVRRSLLRSAVRPSGPRGGVRDPPAVPVLAAGQQRRGVRCGQMRTTAGPHGRSPQVGGPTARANTPGAAPRNYAAEHRGRHADSAAAHRRRFSQPRPHGYGTAHRRPSGDGPRSPCPAPAVPPRPATDSPRPGSDRPRAGRRAPSENALRRSVSDRRRARPAAGARGGDPG
eukprot:TRINITY_DN60663_c0_g1_i1.p1 TRINITY_DN60663_c0_g1~~TRINITY_DN60663_c0_g1_i1.p1  ORF type:complete len:836 (+),score=133.28 TRINITY_DN60663_c0_g1_i1:324-2510(+)